MEWYHAYFGVLKVLVIIVLAIFYFKIISFKPPVFILIDTIFKISLGLFNIFFFMPSNKKVKLPFEDRMIVIASGFILLMLIDFQGIKKEFFESKKNVKNLVNEKKKEISSNNKK